MLRLRFECPNCGKFHDATIHGYNCNTRGMPFNYIAILELNKLKSKIEYIERRMEEDRNIKILEMEKK